MKFDGYLFIRLGGFVCNQVSLIQPQGIIDAVSKLLNVFFEIELVKNSFKVEGQYWDVVFSKGDAAAEVAFNIREWFVHLFQGIVVKAYSLNELVDYKLNSIESYKYFCLMNGYRATICSCLLFDHRYLTSYEIINAWGEHIEAMFMFLQCLDDVVQ